MNKALGRFLLLLIAGCGIPLVPEATFAQTNLAENGSFETNGGGSILFAGWTATGGVIGHINEFGANGSKNFLEMSSGARIRQDVPTIAGRSYIIRFALRDTSGPVRIWWNGATLGVTNYSSSIDAAWADTSITSIASTSSISSLEFESVSGSTMLDDVRVGWLEEIPSIQTQVASRSTFEGGSVTFRVLAVGGPPLAYQWSFHGIPIVNATNNILTVTNAGHSDDGDDYVVKITNLFGEVTSLPATLRVLPIPKAPQIISQPKNLQMTAGYSAGFYVFAVGASTLSYQWRFNNVDIPAATNSHLSIAAAGLSNAGPYSVLVSNHFGTTLSIPGTLAVQTGQGGGYVNWGNTDYADVDAPVFDTDGTLLAGTNFVAQLYAGATSNSLHAVDSWVPFYTDEPGYYWNQVARIPDVFAFATAYLQVRVWDRTHGETFEESQALGGKFGKSQIMPVVLHYFINVPQALPALQSFTLQAGQPLLATAKLYLGSVLPDQNREWFLVGEVGAQYVVDYREPPNDWFPLMQVTNLTGTVTFVDTNSQNSSLKFYRARILEP